MNNDINDILSGEYIIVQNESYHYDTYRDQKLKLLEDLNLISSLKVGYFISNGIIVNNTYLNKIWNYYTDYSKDTIVFIKQTIDLAKEFNNCSYYKCYQHDNCNYINRNTILTEIKNALLGIKCFKENCTYNVEISFIINSIILDLESYINYELININYQSDKDGEVIYSKMIDSKNIDRKIIEDYKISDKITNNKISPREINRQITNNKISPREINQQITNNKITPGEIIHDKISLLKIPLLDFTNSKISPREITPRLIINGKITPRQITPREFIEENLKHKLTPRQLTPRELTPRQLTPRELIEENLNDSFFGDTVIKFPVYNLSSIEKESRNYEYISKLRNLLKHENSVLNRKVKDSKLNSEQINHNINIIQNYIYAM